MERDRGIGILCQMSKPVFSEVPERLRDAAFQVRFVHPHSRLSPGQIADLSMIVGKNTLQSALQTPRHS